MLIARGLGDDLKLCWGGAHRTHGLAIGAFARGALAIMSRHSPLWGTPLVTRAASELERVLDQLETQEKPLPPESLEHVAQAIAAIFRVQADEVAVMELLPPGKLLGFVLPEKFRAVGTIPLTSTTALAARTARERRSDIINNFASTRHASVFEGVPLGRRQSESIQKMMSVPILRGDRVIGVAQICRKGISSTDAGPDFSTTDLTELQGLSSLLSRFLALNRSG